MLAPIWVYRRTLSRIMPPVCRFRPSCSQYAWIVIGRHGAWRGGILAAWRLLRCQPFARGGCDPPPEAWPGWRRLPTAEPFPEAAGASPPPQADPDDGRL